MRRLGAICRGIPTFARAAATLPSGAMKKLAATALLALLVAGTASSSTAHWQLLPKKVTGAGVEVFLPLGWTSGRAWFVGPRYGATGTNLNVVSARVGGGRLASFVKSGLRASSISYRLVLGSSILVYPGSGPTQLARLGADGKIGDPHPLAGDPEAKVKALLEEDIGYHAVTGAQVGGRAVWVFAGSHGRSHMAACCTTSGEARDLTSLLSNRSMGIVGRQTLGVDGQGRLWLFWEDCVEKCRLARNLRAVQLDRETLAPRAPNTLRQEIARDRFQLVCAAACRAVFSSRAIQSWDGESSPKTIARGGYKELLTAGYRKGKLTVGYLKYSPGVPTSIVVGQGNAAGLHLRTTSSIKIPNTLGRWSPIGSPLAAFTPHGVVAVQACGTFSVSRFAAAVLR